MKINENKLPVSINNYIQGMHMVFSDIKCQWKTDMRNRTLAFQKKIELVFEIGFPVN